MMTDVDEIRRLSDDYCWYADTHNVDGIVSLFTADGIMDATAVGLSVIQGEQGLRGFYAKIIPLHEYSQHFSGTHRIDIEGDTAEGTSYYIMHGALREAGPISAAGYFEDKYLRTREGWRIASRRGVPLLPPNLGPIKEWMGRSATNA